ncbi:MAG: hypothetical protein ACE5J2_07520 [Nitrososphaerales archaeon]
MEKLFLAIIIAGAVGVGYALASTFTTQSSTAPNTSSAPIIILPSVEKNIVGYNHTESWGVKGLPPYAGYVATLRWSDTAVVIDSGTADANGEASGSFLVVEEIPAGKFVFRVELASDAGKFGETSVDLVPGVSIDFEPSNIVVSIEKNLVAYNDTQTWSVKGLPPNADYTATLRWPDTALIIDSGTADANGEASGSFLVGEEISAGKFVFRVELASFPAMFGEVSMDLIPPEE